MSNNKMLIDATHPEETRVVVLRNGRVEEFDFESAARKLLRGNIYLAKVTRVEPSLQAAFVEYGGNRHGFLAFNEIHPDYYQIPMADRQALLEEEAAAEAAEEAAVDAHAEALARRRGNRPSSNGEEGAQSPHGEDAHDSGSEGEYSVHGGEGSDSDHGDHGDHGDDHDDHGDDHENDADGEGQSRPRTMAESSIPEDDHLIAPEAANEDDAANENTFEPGSGSEAAAREEAPAASETGGEGGVQEVAAAPEAERVEQVGSAEDALEELPSRPRRRPRSYKIQEVIKRRQVILVQVVKEERGNKGAALTTYLSLAGRYTVLMPNTARGGGISRKITNPQDRKRLKAIAAELEVPEGMGLIIRTAGAARTKQEIKRDFEYLLRLWESVRDLTLQSQAPSLVYEEGNLIKRSIRDLYNKDVEEIVVAGGVAFNEAKDFMRMLMPSHAKNVISYEEPEPLFTRYQIERQLNAMFSPYVTLRSGGYLVINQTEALVAIDVNSGKATREFSIEETAHNTNLEASDEIARQLKLRDLAGLIVIDFIDMEEKRNNRQVERRLKEALRFDRARIQVGRISHFGLLEMSRQRLRTGVLEGSTTQCQHCQGTGIIRSTELVALAVLRGLEDAITAGARTPLVATTTPSVALYILNNKRAFINDMEARHGMPISIAGSDKLAGANFTIERGAAPALPQRRNERVAVNMEWGFEGEEDGEGGEAKEVAASHSHSGSHSDAPRAHETRSHEPRSPSDERGGGENGNQRGKRRRRRRGGRRDDRPGGGEGEHRNASQGSFEGDDADNEVETIGNGGGAHDDHDHEHDHAHDHANGNGNGNGDGAPREHRAGEGENRGPRNRRRGRRGGRRGRERNGRNGEGGSAPGTGQQPDLSGEPHSAQDANGFTGETAHAAHEPVSSTPEPRFDRNEGRGSNDRAQSGNRGGRPPRERAPAPDRAPAHDRETTAAMPESRSAPEARYVEPERAAPEPQRSAPEPQRAAPETEAPKRSRRQESSSEPRLERVVVGEARQEAEPPSASEGAGPTRKGWWQRRLGSE